MSLSSCVLSMRSMPGHRFSGSWYLFTSLGRKTFRNLCFTSSMLPFPLKTNTGSSYTFACHPHSFEAKECLSSNDCWSRHQVPEPFFMR